LLIMLGAGASFFLWQNQKDIKEINKNLPDGIKVTKDLFSSDDYTVVNKIDGYEFKLPKESFGWNGFKKIIYRNVTKDEIGYGMGMEDEIKKEINSETVLGIQEKNEWLNVEVRKFEFNENMTIDKFVKNFELTYTPYKKLKVSEISPKIDRFSVENFNVFKLYGEIKSVTGEESPMIYPTFYFFSKNFSLYLIIYNYEKNNLFISEIIKNGKW